MGNFSEFAPSLGVFTCPFSPCRHLHYSTFPLTRCQFVGIERRMGVTERVPARAAAARRAPSTETRLVRRVCDELLSPFSSVTEWWLFTPFSVNTKAASFYTTEWWLGGAIGRPLSGKIWNCKARGFRSH